MIGNRVSDIYVNGSQFDRNDIKKMISLLGTISNGVQEEQSSYQAQTAMTDDGDIAIVVTSIDPNSGVPTSIAYVDGVEYTGKYTVTQTEDFEIQETLLCRSADSVTVSILRMFSKNTQGVLPIAEVWIETVSGLPIEPLEEGTYTMGSCTLITPPYVDSFSGILDDVPVVINFLHPVKAITFFGNFSAVATFNTPVTGNATFIVNGAFTTVQDTQMITALELHGSGEYIINAQN